MSADRKEFEAWASSPEFGLTQAHFTLDEDGEYLNYPAHCYWLVWQGCQKHMQEQVYSANASLENAVAHMQSVCAERDTLKTDRSELKFALECIANEDVAGSGIARLALKELEQ